MAVEENVSKWAAIVDSPATDETKITHTVEPSSADPEPVSKWASLDIKDDVNTDSYTYDNRADIDLDNYRDELGGDIFLPEGDNGIDILNADRADNQSWYNQAGNFLTQAVVGEIIGGTIEGIGYLLDWQGMANLVTGDEKEFTNWFSDIGKGIREKTQEATQIHEQTPGEMNLLDSGYWFKNSVSIASTLSMLLPTMAAAKGLGMLGRGASKLIGKGGRKISRKLGNKVGDEAFDISKKMGIQADWMTEGITQAVVSRHIENSMEASGTFEEIFEERMTQINKETGLTYTKEEARESAAGAASENYKHGWAMLAQDMVQYLSIGKVFNPVTRQMEVARKLATKSNVPKWAKKGAAVIGTFASEAGEEGYQHYIASRAKLGSDLKAGLISKEEYESQLSEVITSDESKTSMLFGGFGGSVFQMAGPGVNKAFKSKDRKQIEEAASANFNSGLDIRNKSFAALQLQKNKADAGGNAAEIQRAQDDIITAMVLDGIDSDNLEMVMEAILNGPEMTQEEMDKFQKDNSQEWDPAIAKEGAKRALEVAQKVKDIHYKNLSKAKNKNVESNIVKSMSRIEFQNTSFSEIFDKSKKEQANLIDSIKYDNINKPSDSFKNKNDLESRILATKAVMAQQQMASDKAIDDDVKKMKANVIKRHNQNLAALDKEHKALLKDEGVVSEAKGAGAKANQTAYENDQLDIVSSYMDQLAINDAISENQVQLTKLNDKNFQVALVNKQTEAMINQSTDKEALQSLSDRIEKGEVRSYVSKKDISGMVDKIQKRLAAIEKAELAEKGKEADAKAEAELKNIAADKSINEKNPPNSTIHVDVTEALEDESVGEERWFEEEFANDQEKAVESKVDNGKNTALLDGFQEPVPGKAKKKDEITSAGYKQWLHDGLKKIGTRIRYEMAKRGIHRADLKSKGAQAVRAFDAAVKNKTKMPQIVYDYMPIQAFVGDGDKINTFLPDIKSSFGGPAAKKRYEENYASERRNIIDAWARGETVESVVEHTAGGELQTQVDEDGVVAENNIKDLQQIKKSKKRPHIVYSNADGHLIEMDKKEYNKKFRNKQLSVGENEDGTAKPYRGGLFIILKKSDGTDFPVRVNFLRNTNEQAEVLADILLDIAVPDSNEKGTKKKYKLNTPFSAISEDLQQRIKEEMGPELDLLMKGNSDPILMDIMNMFVYTSDKTEGLTSELYMKYNNLYFGGKGKSLTPDNKATNRQELVDFLRDTKRRQLSISMWNNPKDFPGYRDFVFDNKIINTNVVVGQAEFQTETAKEYNEAGGQSNSGRNRRRVQVWIKPIPSKVAPKPIQVEKGQAVKTVVDVTTVESQISEASGPTLKEENERIATKFPRKKYEYGFKTVGGNTVTIFGENIVPEADLKAIEQIKFDMQAEFNAENFPVDVIESRDLKPNGGLTSNIGQYESYVSPTMEITVHRRTKDDKPSPNRTKDDVFKVTVSKSNSAGDIMKISKPMTKSFATHGEAATYAEKFIAKDKVKKQQTVWQKFVDTGVVTEFQINKIADAIINNEPLTTQQMAMRKVASKEIEVILTKATEVNDTQISKSDKKTVSSVPTRTIRTRGRSVGSGSSQRAPRRRVEPITKQEDDKKTPGCTPGK